EGNRLYNSPSYHKVLGYTAEELKSSSSFDQIHPDDRNRVREAAAEAQRTGVGRPLEYRIRHKDGTWRVLESNASVIGSSAGEAAHHRPGHRARSERGPSGCALLRCVCRGCH